MARTKIVKRKKTTPATTTAAKYVRLLVIPPRDNIPRIYTMLETDYERCRTFKRLVERARASRARYADRCARGEITTPAEHAALKENLVETKKAWLLFSEKLFRRCTCSVPTLAELDDTTNLVTL